jgi:uncharacterized damage-inducible protein DinB
VHDEATRIDPEAKTVSCRSGHVVRYDFLVVATGAELVWEVAAVPPARRVCEPRMGGGVRRSRRSTGSRMHLQAVSWHNGRLCVSRAVPGGRMVHPSFMLEEPLMKGLPVAAAALVLLAASHVDAQTPANPMQASTQAVYNTVKGNLAKTAEKVSEDLYAFKPTPEVRSLGQIIGHVADAQFGICSTAAGEKPPQTGVEKSATTKAALSKALNDSIAYCDKVIASLDDKKGAELVKFFGGQMTRLGVLSFNTAHSYEHYGNLVTYMRLKGIVPPSSEGSK